MPNLRELSLEQTGIEDEGVKDFCEALHPPTDGGDKYGSVADTRLSALKELELSDKCVFPHPNPPCERT